jgi:acyl-lipid omega-6 desaturase (Delta-12 desaturase)
VRPSQKRSEAIPQSQPVGDQRATARLWAERLKEFARPSTKHGVRQLIVTVVPLIGLWVAMALTLEWGYWITLLLAVPAAGFVVRLFMIQHDCGHYSFFRSRRANDMLGRAISLFTLTPHKYWRDAHAIHHATSGNLDARGIGDVSVLTVREYRALPFWRRMAYRLYRNPVVLFGIAPTWVFVIKFRLPLDLLRQRRRLLPDVMLTTVLSGLVVTVMGLVIGFGTFTMVQVPITLLATTIGVWLFYVQHQFEDTHWAEEGAWDFHTAALEGSSYFHMPRVLQWFTANIGAHHIHHLCSRIPNYRLEDCLARYPELKQVNRVTLWQSLKCIPLSLWDEDTSKLISFRAMKRQIRNSKNDA